MKPSAQLGLLVALAVIALAVYARACRPTISASTAGQVGIVALTASGQAAGPGGDGAVEARRIGHRAVQRERAERLAWSRDPFTRRSVSGLALSGIVWDPAHPLAIINGRTVTMGEELDGFRVVTIAQDHVAVTDGTDTFVLTILP